MDSSALELVGVAWGIGRMDRLVRRSGARAGDAIIATCDLGRGWAGYLMNHFGLRGRIAPELAEEADCYHDFTRAPIEAILECAEAGLITSGMDLSDGALEFCHTIADRNNLGVRVNEEALGVHPLVEAVSRELGLRPGHFALDPGYDFPYAHGYTVKSDALDEVLAIFDRHHSTCTVLGTVVEEPGVDLVRADGSRVALPPFWSDQTDGGDDRVKRWCEKVSSL